MAEEIAADIITKIIEKLGSAAFKKIKFAKDLDSHVERLEEIKSIIAAELHRFDPFEVSTDLKGNKIKRLQRIYDELVYFFEEQATRTKQKEVMRGSKIARIATHVRLFWSSSNQLVSPFIIAKKVNAINVDLKNLASDYTLYRSIVSDSSGNQNRCTLSEETGPFPVADVLIGRDRDKENIVNMICNSSNDQVVAIVGVGGQGKTTLAQFVCQDDWVKGSFDLLLWVSITPHSSIKEIFAKIIASATGMKPISCGLQGLQQQVLLALVGKKCLLVLDNVSYEENLKDNSEALNAILKRGGFWGNGGKVLITTRSKAAAKLMDTLKLYELRDLAEDDCWILLRSYAIKQEDKKESGVEEIGKEIAKMCPKVPLVLKIIGRHLADKDYKSQWEHFKNELALNPTVYMSKDGNIKQILKLCYDQLDYNLKRCGAFCSLFPKGHVYDKHYMVRNWIALGFVDSKEGMSLEDVGDAYVFELTQRAFFEEARDYGVFKMHDVMHDLMRLIGKDKHQMIDSKTKDINEGVRHVSLNIQELNWEVLLSSVNNGKQTLESILLVWCSRDNPIHGVELKSGIDRLIQACQKLKVLEIYGQEIKNVPRSIGKLTLVRHLNLSRNPLFELPDEITNMVNLSTLDLSQCGNLRKLPSKIGKLVNLVSLKLSSCKNLQELPEDMGKLVKLRVLLVRGCKLRFMPKGFGNLTELETLDVFVVGESSRSSKGSKGKVGAKLEELSHLKNLKWSLCIKVAGQSKYILSEAGNARLEMEAKLRFLHIEFEKKGEEDEKFLEGIQLCGENLEFLEICDYGGKRLPAWMTDDGFHKRFPKLTSLMFVQTNRVKHLNPELAYLDEHIWFSIDANEDDLEWIPRYSKIKEQLKMGPMELDFTIRRDELKLTHLSDLALDEVCFSITKELAPRCGCDLGGQRQPDFLFKSCFPNLTQLTLSDIPELEVLPEEFRDLSFLVCLSISDCPKLKAIPDWIDTLSCLEELYITYAPELKVLPESIGNLTSLKELDLWDCTGLEFLPRQMSNLPCSPRQIGIQALFEKCERPTGEYWPLLQHLRCIYIECFEGDKSQRKDQVVLLKDQSKNGNSKARYWPLPPNIWKCIWESTLLPSWKEFLCKLLNEDLPTGEYWAKRGFVVDPCCKLCGQGIDTADHIFRTCVFAKHTWQCSILGIVSDSHPQFTLEFWVARYLQFLSWQDGTWGYRVPIFTSVLWALWIHRYEVLFRNATPNPTRVMNLATMWYTSWQITRQRLIMQKMRRLQFKRLKK